MTSCSVCGTHLEGTARRQYCSNACKQKAYRWRKRAEATLSTIPSAIKGNVDWLISQSESHDDLAVMENIFHEIEKSIAQQRVKLRSRRDEIDLSS